MNKKNLFLWSVLGILALIDRCTKFWALNFCQDTVSFTSWFQCDLVINRGVSFGLFHADNTLIFGAVTGSVIVWTCLVVYHAVLQARKGLWYGGELCIIVGSLSNLFDRFMYNGVIDFLVFSCPFGVWPAYNVADALIVCGVALLVLSTYKER